MAISKENPFNPSGFEIIGIQPVPEPKVKKIIMCPDCRTGQMRFSTKEAMYFCLSCGHGYEKNQLKIML